jgi:hypothetical protein
MWLVADGNECVRDARACDAWKCVCVCVSGVVSQSIHGRGQIFFFATTTTLLIAQQSEMLYWAKRGKELGGFLFFFPFSIVNNKQKYFSNPEKRIFFFRRHFTFFLKIFCYRCVERELISSHAKQTNYKSLDSKYIRRSYI